MFECSGSDREPFELERVDFPEGRDGPVFADDQDAWEFVRAQAAAGSALHLRALAFLWAESPVELARVLSGPEPEPVETRTVCGYKDAGHPCEHVLCPEDPLLRPLPADVVARVDAARLRDLSDGTTPDERKPVQSALLVTVEGELPVFDGFEAWQAEQGGPVTVLVDGLEVAG